MIVGDGFPVPRAGRPRPYGKGDRKMKATGIVRRVDDLGRIVIPKEISRTLIIHEGDHIDTNRQILLGDT